MAIHRFTPFVISLVEAETGNAPHYQDVKTKLDQLAADGYDYVICLPEGAYCMAVAAYKEGETRYGIRHDQKVISIAARRP